MSFSVTLGLPRKLKWHTRSITKLRFMSKPNILVTGGAGYIGSHTCKALWREGYRPIVYDNLGRGHKWAVKWGPLEVGHIADHHRLNEVFKKYKPRAVIHFAAFAYVDESMRDPAKYYYNNVAGTLSLLESMRANDIGKLVFSSTCATYGVPIRTPIDENHPQRPINPYGMSKLIVEKMLDDFDCSYDQRFIALRYFNAAGADPDCEIGEAHEPETHLIPLALKAASEHDSRITIFGTDHDTPDGTCIRDYVHVSDLADAHVLALKRLQSGASSQFYNLSNGQGFSVREVVSVVSKVMSRGVNFKIGPRRAGDPPRLVGSASRAHLELGWNAKFRSLESIIETAKNWHEKIN